MNGEETLADVVRLLKGAPAVIFLAQVLHGGPQTVRMLCAHTGYSDKVVRQGLLHLQRMGLSERDRELRAWYLVPGSQALALLRGALATTGRANAVVYRPDHVRDAGGPSALSTELSTGAERSVEAEEYPVFAADPADRLDDSWEQEISMAHHPAEEITCTAAKYGPFPSHKAAPTAEVPSGVWENSALTRENRSAFGEGSSGHGHETSSSPLTVLTTTTAHDPSGQVDQAAVSKHAHAKRQANSRDAAADGRLMFWLSRGGIAPGSPKMREILALKPDLQTVKAHVLERQACAQERVEGEPYYGVGLLIRKLLDGDPPPPMRCETCLRLPDHRGWCRCDYDAVVRR